MPDGHVFGHIRRAKHLTVAFVGWIPAVADEECGRPLGGVSIIVSQNMGAILNWIDNPRITREQLRDLCARALWAAIGLQPRG